MTPQLSRCLMFVIGFGVLVFLSRLGLWYWRIRTMNRDEAQMVLADTGWIEMRREAARQETWRAYGKYRHRPKPPRPKLKPRNKPNKPWVGEAILRVFLIIFVAILIAILLVCAGVYVIDLYRR